MPHVGTSNPFSLQYCTTFSVKSGAGVEELFPFTSSMPIIAPSPLISLLTSQYSISSPQELFRNDFASFF